MERLRKLSHGKSEKTLVGSKAFKVHFVLTFRIEMKALHPRH